MILNNAQRRVEDELLELQEEQRELRGILREETGGPASGETTYRNAFESRKGAQYSLTKDLKKAREIQRKKELRSLERASPEHKPHFAV